MRIDKALRPAAREALINALERRTEVKTGRHGRAALAATGADELSPFIVTLHGAK